MTTPFRLFSLPYLPLKQVLDNIGPEALLYLSLCSLRSRNIAKSYRGPSKNVQLNVHFGHKNYLSYMEGEDSHILLNVENRSELSSKKATVKIGNFCSIPIKMGESGLNTYWEDRMTGLTEIGDYAREVFNRDLYEVCIGGKEAEDDHRRAAEWLKNFQETIQSLECYFKSNINNDIDFILENFKSTEKLVLQVNPPLNYCPAKPPNFNVEFLYVIYSFWIKQDHLLTMNCKMISLHDSKLTSRDFNVFLKHWKAGGCSQLRELGVDVEESIDYRILLDGLGFVEIGRDLARVYVNEVEHHITIRGGFDIKRPSDNVKATIINGGENWKHFLMIVWPDFAGNSYED